MADTDMMPEDGSGIDHSEPVGLRLKHAREAAGLSLAQLSQTTKIPTRMLGLIEDGDFAALPSRIYATGFTRSYARALGLNEAEYVAAVRAEIGLSGAVEPPPATTFEPGDPARVPTARLAWLAALGAIAVLAAGLLLWRSYYAPAVSLPELPLPEETTAAPVPAPAALPQAEVETESALGEPTDAATAPSVVQNSSAPRRVAAPRQLRGKSAAGETQSAALPLPGDAAGTAPQPASTGTN